MTSETGHTRKLPLSYDEVDSDNSARRLVFEIYPHWESEPGLVLINRFTEGVMNTLLKITKEVPGRSEIQNDQEAVLLRAYGRDSDILINREMEVLTHAQLADRGLASPIVARFQNGLLYKFLPGRVCAPADLLEEPIWRAIAARLGRWHAQLPLPASGPGEQVVSDASTLRGRTIWTVLKEWVEAIPSETEEAANRKAALQEEVRKSFLELVPDGREDYSNYVVGHCDLLCANVIIPTQDSSHTLKGPASRAEQVHFIDYEYAVPCPPAFDLANHFSEWGGFECDYNLLPSQNLRKEFIEEYLQSFSQSSTPGRNGSLYTVEQLCHDVDQYRGLPGLCWGVHALIQEKISDVKFDWGAYSEVRLAEFWAWRREIEGTRSQAGELIPLRERRWAEED